MDIHERIQKINELKQKYPEFDKAYTMNTLCNAARICADITNDPSMNPTLSTLIVQLESELDMYFEA